MKDVGEDSRASQMRENVGVTMITGIIWEENESQKKKGKLKIREGRTGEADQYDPEIRTDKIVEMRER